MVVVRYLSNGSSAGGMIVVDISLGAAAGAGAGGVVCATTPGNMLPNSLKASFSNLSEDEAVASPRNNDTPFAVAGTSRRIMRINRHKHDTSTEIDVCYQRHI